MKLAVIELECHAEVLRSFVKLLLKVAEIELSVYTTVPIWEETQLRQADLKPFKLVLKGKNETTDSFLTYQLQEINKQQIVVFNTLQENFSLINKLTIQPQIWVRVHNSNFYFADKNEKTKDLSAGGLTLSLKKWLRREKKHQRQFLERVDRFIFPNQAITDWAIKHFDIDIKKIMQPPIPLVYFSDAVPDLPAGRHGGRQENKQIFAPDSVFRLAVIGTLDPERRDYDFLKSVLGSFLAENKKKVQLILLGAVRGDFAQKTLAALQNLAPQKMEVHHYTNLVEQAEFDKQLKTVDAIFAPLKLETSFHVSPERYGFTKVSGSVNDALVHRKKILLPLAYGVEPDLKDFMLTYTTQEECVQHLLYLEGLQGENEPQIPGKSYYRLENQLDFLREMCTHTYTKIP